MPETSSQNPAPSRALALVASAKAACNRVIRMIPAKARLPVLVGSLVLVALAVYTSLSGGSATLNLICHHDLRSADITVSIDGKTIYTDHIAASPKKFYDVLLRRSETFSKSLTVPSGEHIVQVHLSSATDGFDQTKQHELNLLPGNEATLVMSAQQGGMSLAYQGHVTSPPKSIGSTYSDSLRWILVTLLGSGVSAIIGFFVQEFLRSKKQPSQQTSN
jgi:hypothetical protein